MATSTKHIVMLRVRTIHALKAAVGGAGASALLLVTSLYVIGREVWVARVWENMPSITDVTASSHFFTYAFMHTQLSVQILLLSAILAFVWFVREFARVLVLSRPRLA